MIYLGVAAAAVAVAIWFLSSWASKDRNLPYRNMEEYRDFCGGLKVRTLALPKHERLVMVAEARRLAEVGYDRLFEEAKRLGKNDSFAHQAGALDAIFCVFANDDRMRKHDEIRQLMRLETLPFNISPPVTGRREIIEYIIWKVSPADADFTSVEAAISRFVKQIMSDAEKDENPDRLVHTMIYANHFDWQRVAIEMFDKNRKLEGGY